MHLSLGLLPSEGDDVALGFGKFDADLVYLARVLGGVAALDYLLQGAIGLRFALDYFEFDDIGMAGELDSKIDVPQIGDVLRCYLEAHTDKEAINH